MIIISFIYREKNYTVVDIKNIRRSALFQTMYFLIRNADLLNELHQTVAIKTLHNCCYIILQMHNVACFPIPIQTIT